MHTRRKSIQLIIGGLAGFFFLSHPLGRGVRWVWAQAERIVLPKGTNLRSLIRKDPARLDASNLDLTPLKEFGTMGLTDHVVNLETWRLEVMGHVRKPLSLTYSEVLDLPPIERRVLLICPGFFANHGQWKGVSILDLLQKADIEGGATHVTISGPGGDAAKTFRCPIEDIRSEKVFLAYQVNGEDLPRKHGFPLRLVAEDYYGADWVKYVSRITAEKT